MGNIPHVKRVMVLEAPLVWEEAILLAFPLGEMCSIFSMFGELGSGGEALAYHMGFKAGERLHERMVSQYMDSKEILEHFLMFNEGLGRGSFKIKEYEEGKYCTIQVKDFLLEYLGTSEARIGNSLFRGLLAGLFTKLWNTQVKIEETKCITKGEPYCEFHIKTA
jgi:predicted hydrocarbon binding protein